MKLEITRDEERCLECMFLDADGWEGNCLLFKQELELHSRDEEYKTFWKPCNECNLVWRKL